VRQLCANGFHTRFQSRSSWTICKLLARENPAVAGLSMMERTGIEPVTSGLQSRVGLDDVERRPATSEAQSHKPCGIAGI
jgi:hypothetical protein